MCLAVPARVVDVYREDEMFMGRVDFGGVGKRVCLDHVPDVKPGDYVLVHVGFALARIDEQEARRVLDFLQGSADLEEELGPPE